MTHRHTHAKKKSKSIIPGFGLSFGIVMAILGIIVVIPRIAEMSTREMGPCSRTTFRICIRLRRFRSSLLIPQSFMFFFLFLKSDC